MLRAIRNNLLRSSRADVQHLAHLGFARGINIHKLPGSSRGCASSSRHKGAIGIATGRSLAHTQNIDLQLVSVV